jgi:hypothetical protein
MGGQIGLGAMKGAMIGISAGAAMQITSNVVNGGNILSGVPGSMVRGGVMGGIGGAAYGAGNFFIGGPRRSTGAPARRAAAYKANLARTPMTDAWWGGLEASAAKPAAAPMISTPHLSALLRSGSMSRARIPATPRPMLALPPIGGTSAASPIAIAGGGTRNVRSMAPGGRLPRRGLMSAAEIAMNR